MQSLVDGRAHAYAIKLELASVLGHSSVYAALAAAEAKGYLTSRWEESNAGGPRRRYYELTAEGRAVLNATQAAERARARNSASAQQRLASGI